ncbi:MAG: bifunctional nuclease family protein [Fimbriimonadaceae bacterium]
MPEDFEPEDDPENLSEPPAFFPQESMGPVNEPGDYGRLIEVSIEGVFAMESSGTISRFVLLTEGRRRLPIVIGPFEAQAISLPLDGKTPDRPMTHDLIKNVLDRLATEIDRVVIDDLWNTIYYAKVFLRKGNEEMQIDARPSDAIALAVRANAPIFVAEGILEAASEE